MSETRDKVLLVDDEPTTRLVLRRALEQRGFEVKDADGGQKALGLFPEFAPDIVLLDALMPDMDGFATCTRLRALPAGQHVPILMLTGLNDDQSIAHAYDAGATDFFVKAPQMTLLAERVRYLLRTARMQADLVRSRSALAQAQRIARLGSWEWNLGAGKVNASEEARRILGLENEASDVAEAVFIPALYRDGLDAFRLLAFTSLRAGRAHRFATDLFLSDGHLRPVEVELEGERNKEGRISRVLGTVQDMSERRETEEQMHKLASFDSLTGLANLNLFRQRLLEEMLEAKRTNEIMAVLVMNLDSFKTVNKTLGAAAGDAVLREIALRLSRTVRARDRDRVGAHDGDNAAVARVGGDEFAIIARGIALPEHVERIAERLLETVRKPVMLESGECRVGASIGAALFPRDAGDAEILLQRSEFAMTQSRQAGRGGYRVYSPENDEKSAARFRLESDLRNALDRKELRLHWQPIIEGRSGKVSGAEVLMRWQRGDKLVPPLAFIPIAQELGLIVPMTEWAVNEACSQLADWQRAGIGFDYVSVNITSGHFQERNLLTFLRTVLEQTGLPASGLQLEITETMMMDSLDTTLRTIRNLRDTGVRFAIDDFGTGYSSLSYLKRLPVTSLKIDRSFVKDLDTGGDDDAIVGAISSLARTLKLAVVAEGVETAGQRDALLARGVEYMQGYYYSKPLPATDFEALLRNSAVRESWRLPAA